MELRRFVNELSVKLDINRMSGVDSSLNGLQVGNLDSDIKKVAFAVDACMDSFKEAADSKADVLVVHHGLFWGRPIAVTGVHYQRIKFLLDHNLSLFACHLPLDADPVYGNNIQMAKALDLDDIQSFAIFRGTPIGFKGRLKKPMTLSEIRVSLGLTPQDEKSTLEFGKKLCETVGIVSGSAADDLDSAIDEGLDLFITGEPSHVAYHQCEEHHINMLCLGHYATETFGVKALMGLVSDMGLDTTFVDVPTGL